MRFGVVSLTGFFFFFPFSSPLYSISLVVFDVGFAFGFV